MTRRALQTRNAAASLAVCAVLIASCGGDSGDSRPAATGPELATEAVIDKDPYTIACGHVRDQQQWAAVTRRATVAIAARERFPKMSRLRATQSLFYAMTELCEQQPASHQPAEAAVTGVRQGKFVADLSKP